MLAIDIDDTICHTTLRRMRIFQERFGNPEGLSPPELIEKYEIVQNIPYRQTPKAQQLIKSLVKDDHSRSSLPAFSDARQALHTLTKYIPIIYLTSRTEQHRKRTDKWLKNNNFPHFTLIMRPNTPGEFTNVHTQFVRKTNYLLDNYPHISGIIDNSITLAKQLDQASYPGINILFGHTENTDIPEKQQLQNRTEVDKVLALLKK